MKPRVAIVNSKSFGRFTDAISRLAARCIVDQIEVSKNASGKELAEKLFGYHFVVASVTPRYDEEFFKSNLDVVMILRHGIGLDNVDLKAAEEHGVKIVAVPGYKEREAVAEHTVALMLSALRHIVEANNSVRKGEWQERAKFVSRNISSLTIGVIGFGNIGSKVAEILRKGFGSKVIAYDPYVQEEKMKALEVIPASSIAELMAKSDIVTLHTNLSPETYHIISREMLMGARRGIIVVNTARGELIDQDALVEAIEKGIVSGVALDVVEKEPIGLEHPLLKYSNVVITPHIAAYTREALAAMDDTIVEAIFNYLDKKTIEGIIVDPMKCRNLRICLKSVNEST
ncbi:MAG: D-isomer specific 2-hydroxyacid dehydrogenase family protein [Crenarchaeota archaeon]|nr:D-isomer specific 2-hydroxyacid dehydrogenase family protein [Thermoproteota archaeon]